MSLTYRSPTADDILHVAENMRQEDILEVAASSGHTPLAAVTWSVMASTRSYAALWNGEPICIFGFSDDLPEATSAWLLGTDQLVSSPVRRTFLREARRITNEWAATFGCIFNLVDASAKVTRRWLAWLGFTERGVVESHGVAETPFVLVTKTHV